MVTETVLRYGGYLSVLVVELLVIAIGSPTTPSHSPPTLLLEKGNNFLLFYCHCNAALGVMEPSPELSSSV